MHFNAITLVGTASSTPELRFFESGSVRARVRLRVAASPDGPTYANPDGEEALGELDTEVEAWGPRAQLLAESIRIGHTFGVSGRLLLAANDGSPRVLADHITFP